MNTLPDTLYTPLHRALSVKRPAGSVGEAQFRAWLCRTYSHYLEMIDEAGNLWFKTTPASKTLFAAHADTCHRTEGPNPFTVKDGIVKAGAECLGADDGAGVAILCHLMANNIPGTYLFTTQEEVGGVGASYVADNFPDLLEQFDRSICFDRAGTEEIITVQGGQRCASPEFAEALSLEFEKQGMLYAESTRGVYTDNKEFAGSLSENVNLGVGYERQHGPKESLDLNHLEKLADAVLKIDWEALPTVRKASGFATFGDEWPIPSPFSNEWPISSPFYDEWPVPSTYTAIESCIEGNYEPLRRALVEELALRNGIPEAEAERYISTSTLTIKWMKGLPFFDGESAVLDALLEKTTLN